MKAILAGPVSYLRRANAIITDERVRLTSEAIQVPGGGEVIKSEFVYC